MRQDAPRPRHEHGERRRAAVRAAWAGRASARSRTSRSSRAAASARRPSSTRSCSSGPAARARRVEQRAYLPRHSRSNFRRRSLSTNVLVLPSEYREKGHLRCFSSTYCNATPPARNSIRESRKTRRMFQIPPRRWEPRVSTPSTCPCTTSRRFIPTEPNRKPRRSGLPRVRPDRCRQEGASDLTSVEPSQRYPRTIPSAFASAKIDKPVEAIVNASTVLGSLPRRRPASSARDRLHRRSHLLRHLQPRIHVSPMIVVDMRSRLVSPACALSMGVVCLGELGAKPRSSLGVWLRDGRRPTAASVCGSSILDLEAVTHPSGGKRFRFIAAERGGKLQFPRVL